MSIAVTDHLGNTFNKKTDMCKYWGISPVTFNARVRRGKTLEQALTGDGIIARSKKSTDHLGKIFPTKHAMCEYWGIDIVSFNARVRRGKALEQALTEKIRRDIPPELTSIEGKMQQCGLTATVIRYNPDCDLEVEFEDGENQHCSKYNFSRGQVGHPVLCANPKRKKWYYGSFTTKCLGVDSNGNRLYVCECHECNSGPIITTAKQMLDHIRREHPDLIVNGKIKHCGITNGLLGW